MNKPAEHLGPNIWLKFSFRGVICIGRTFDNEGLLMVSYVDENAVPNTVPVLILSDIVRLGFVKNISSKPSSFAEKQPGFETSVVSSERCGEFVVQIAKN